MASESVDYFAGQRVCCCDLMHRTVASVDGDDVTTEDGIMWSGENCLMPVEEDGHCHRRADPFK